MTDQGYDFVIEKIVNRMITMPYDNYNLDLLSAWLSGYAKCQHDIIDIIDGLKKGSQQRDC